MCKQTTPSQALPGEADVGPAYGQVRVGYAFNANLTGAVEAVHYVIGDALRKAGGHDGSYLGIEFGW